MNGALICGGISVVGQQVAYGSVNWHRVGVEAAVGGLVGGAGRAAFRRGAAAGRKKPTGNPADTENLYERVTHSVAGTTDDTDHDLTTPAPQTPLTTPAENTTANHTPTPSTGPRHADLSTPSSKTGDQPSQPLTPAQIRHYFDRMESRSGAEHPKNNKRNSLIQFYMPGGLDQANVDFSHLTTGIKPFKKTEKISVATLADGSTVNVRSFSKQGSPTLEVRYPRDGEPGRTGPTRKYRYTRDL